MAASRRYYPGFFGALFIILMRLAIGWHLFHEGRTKVESLETDAPFTSEAYLRNATGPFAEHFRSLVPDPDSIHSLKYDYLEQTWDRDFQRVAAHFQFNDEQREQARARLEDAKEVARAWYEDPEIQEKIENYREDLASVREREKNPPTIAFQRERLSDDRVELERLRQELVAPIDRWTEQLHESWFELATPDQLETAGAFRPPMTDLQRVDAITMYGLMIVGLCLMFGFLTPLAALGAAGFLLLFYISMPPFPWLPPNPQAEGTYLWVNKNLIEMLACLVLASTPNGMWAGVDAVLFGWIDRRMRARAAESEAAEARTG